MNYAIGFFSQNCIFLKHDINNNNNNKKSRTKIKLNIFFSDIEFFINNYSKIIIIIF